jgi:phosphoadenosine phosphosulfate reductase
MRVTEASLEPLNERFLRASPVEILRFVHRIFGRRAALLTSMQRAGTLLGRVAEREGLDFDVLFVDTGLLHPQTLATRDELSRTHGRLTVLTLLPERSFEEQTAEEGLLYLSKEGQERCCDLRKKQPLTRVRGRYDVLVSGLRRDEGGARARVLPFSIDAEMRALRVHPFAAVTREELDRMIADDPEVIVNPLHAMGFSTIGCYPCTTPVRPDESERAGRWRHLEAVAYCGINPVDRGGASEAIEIADRYADGLGLTSATAQ